MMEIEKKDNKQSRSRVDEATLKRDSCRKKIKRRERKELLDSLVEIYVKEKASKQLNKQQQFKKILPFQEANVNSSYCTTTTPKKPKTRQSKKTIAKDSDLRTNQPSTGNGKVKRMEKPSKYKSGSKQYEVFNKLPKTLDTNTPVVVLHHRGEKPFKKSKEHLPLHFSNQHKNTRKSKIKNITEPADHIKLTYDETMCNDINFNTVKPLKEKKKSRTTSIALCEMPNISSEQKVRTKRQKRYIRESFPVGLYNDSSSPKDNPINHSNGIPISIEDRPSNLMKLFRIASVFQGYKDKKKYEDFIKLYCDRSKQEKDQVNTNLKENLRNAVDADSLRKVNLHQRHSSKRLKGLKSGKSLRKHKKKSKIISNMSKQLSHVQLEHIPKSLNSVKSRKVLKKRKIKNSPFDRLTTNNNQRNRLDPFLFKQKDTLIQSRYQNHKEDVNLVNNYCGDECTGVVGEVSSQPSSQNKKLSTIYSESSATNGIAEKESPEFNQLDNSNKTQTNNNYYFSKTSKSAQNDENYQCNSEKDFIGRKGLGKISIVKPTLSEDGKKITFQVVKSQFSSRNIDKLNKQLFKLNNKHLVKASRESLSMKQDRLMLFYAAQESSLPSQDSLNVAISKDTELSNNGDSEGVFKVVIKQTESLLSSSKTPVSTDNDLDKDESKKECAIINLHNVKVSNQERERTLFEKDSVGLRKTNYFHNLQSEKDSRESDSQQSITEQTSYQQEPLNMLEFGFFNLKNDPETNPGKTTNTHSLKSSAETEVSKSPRISFPVPVQKSYIKCAMKKKNPRISPKRNQFQPISSSHLEIESIERSTAKSSKVNPNSRSTGLKYKNHKISPRPPIRNDGLDKSFQQNVHDLEHLQLKLQLIGLNQRKSFVKVIETENEENCSEIPQTTLHSKESERLIKTENTNTLLLSTQTQNGCNKIYSPTAGNHSLTNSHSHTYIKTKGRNLKIENIMANCCKTDLSTGLSTANSTLDSSIFMANERVLTKEGHCQEGFCEREGVKTKRDSYVTVLQKGTNSTKETPKQTNRNNTHFQEKVIKEETSFSETGVQTDNPINQIKEHSKTQITFDSLNLSKTSEDINNEISNHSYTKQLFQISDKNTAIASTPEKTNYFVDVVQNCTSQRPSTKESDLERKKVGSMSIKEPVWENSSTSSEILGSLINKKKQPEEQIVYKINAIYDFLQYLDTLLKNTAISKSSDYCQTPCSNIGNFNQTLRCLCSNCIEILQKFDTKQTMEQTLKKCSNKSKSPKRISPLYECKRSLFVSEVSPQKEMDWKTNNALSANNDNIGKVGKPARYGLQRDFFQPEIDNNWNPEPFIFVVPSNERFEKRLTHEYSKRVTNHSLKHMDNKEAENKQMAKSHDYYLQMVDEFDDILLRKKIQHFSRATHETNDSGRFKKTIRREPIEQQGKIDNNVEKLSKKFSSSASGMITRRNDNCKGNTGNFIAANEFSNKTATKTKCVRSDLSLEKPLRRTRKHYSPKNNNQLSKQYSTISRSRGFGDSLSCVEREGYYIRNNVDEKPLYASENGTNIEHKYTDNYSFQNERQTDRRSYKREKLSIKNTRQFLPENTSCSTSPNRKITKNDSIRQSIVKKMCSSGKRVLQNLEKNLVRSVSISKLYLKHNNVMKNNSSVYERLRNNSSVTAVKEQTNLKHSKENTIEKYSRNGLNATRSDSDSSIDSFAFSDRIGKVKNTTVLKHTTKAIATSEKIKNNVSKYNESGQSCVALAQSLTKPTPKTLEDRRSLKSVTSNSSIGSSFSQNNKTLVFTNRHLSCGTKLNPSIESCHCLGEEERNPRKEEEITNKSLDCDSNGWISISSCDLLNKNGEDNSNNRSSFSSNDLEKVRLQMDLGLNDVMHVEFFCHPSDSVSLKKNKNT